MKKYTLYTLIAFSALVTFSACSSDDSYFGEEIFNDQTLYPYVSIQDRNEDLENIPGNNFWNFELTSENNGTQVRIAYDSQDTNIESHQILVGFDDDVSPPEDGVLLRTITQFPIEIIITKQDIATALNIPVEDLNSGSVFFGGISTDSDGHIVNNPDVFEDFLIAERHAYFYEWDFNQ